MYGRKGDVFSVRAEINAINTLVGGLQSKAYVLIADVKNLLQSATGDLVTTVQKQSKRQLLLSTQSECQEQGLPVVHECGFWLHREHALHSVRVVSSRMLSFFTPPCNYTKRYPDRFRHRRSRCANISDQRWNTHHSAVRVVKIINAEQ